MEKKIKIISIDENHKILNDELRKSGYLVDEEYLKSKKELESSIKEYTGIIIRSRFKLDEYFLSKANKLKFIARVGSGMENINCEFANKKNIKLINAPEGNCDSLAEHTLGMLLTLLHKIKVSDNQIRKKIWKREENRGDELYNTTIGIIGYGKMGKALSKRLIGFNVTVLCYDIIPNKSDSFAKQVDLDVIFKQCKIISLHLPLNKSTEYFINRVFINSMYYPFYLINTSRGNCVKTIDLIEALISNKIKGACLDVLEFENSSFENLKNHENEVFNYLINSEKVILTPHIAGWSIQNKKKMAKIILMKINKYLKIDNIDF